MPGPPPPSLSRRPGSISHHRSHLPTQRCVASSSAGAGCCPVTRPATPSRPLASHAPPAVLVVFAFGHEEEDHRHSLSPAQHRTPCRGVDGDVHRQGVGGRAVAWCGGPPGQGRGAAAAAPGPARGGDGTLAAGTARQQQRQLGRPPASGGRKAPGNDRRGCEVAVEPVPALDPRLPGYGEAVTWLYCYQCCWTRQLRPWG